MDAIEIIEQLQQNGYRAKVSVVIEMIPEDVAPPPNPPAPPEPPAPPPNPPEPPEPPAPEEPTRIVYITAGVANARYDSGDNKSGYPIMTMYPSESKDDQGKRVQFARGDDVLIFSKRIDADSAEDFYKIHPSQYDFDAVGIELYLRKSDINV